MTFPSISWLDSPIRCNGAFVRPPLNSDQFNDAVLPDICVRMRLIFESIEFERAEGRLMNLSIFESLDTLHSDLIHLQANRLADWQARIIKFGEYYGLRPHVPIEVNVRAVEVVRTLANSLGIEN